MPYEDTFGFYITYCLCDRAQVHMHAYGTGQTHTEFRRLKRRLMIVNVVTSLLRPLCVCFFFLVGILLLFKVRSFVVFFFSRAMVSSPHSVTYGSVLQNVDGLRGGRSDPAVSEDVRLSPAFLRGHGKKRDV